MRGVAAHPDVMRVVTSAVLVPASLELGWQAFWRLNSSRSIAFGVGYIPYSEISAYARDFGIAGMDFEDLLTVVHILDREYVKLQREKEKGSNETSRSH